MATYPLTPATETWQTLAAPIADAWLQPVGGDVYVSTDAIPATGQSGIVPEFVAYPVSAGVAIKVRAFSGASVSLRMWDRT